jgi:dUTPase
MKMIYRIEGNETNPNWEHFRDVSASILPSEHIIHPLQALPSEGFIEFAPGQQRPVRTGVFIWNLPRDAMGRLVLGTALSLQGFSAETAGPLTFGYQGEVYVIMRNNSREYHRVDMTKTIASLFFVKIEAVCWSREESAAAAATVGVPPHERGRPDQTHSTFVGQLMHDSKQ